MPSSIIPEGDKSSAESLGRVRRERVQGNGGVEIGGSFNREIRIGLRL